MIFRLMLSLLLPKISLIQLYVIGFAGTVNSILNIKGSPPMIVHTLDLNQNMQTWFPL